MSGVKNLIETFSRSFNRDAWHGPAVMEVVEGLTPAVANLRIGDGHSILELLGHMVAWRNFGIKKLDSIADYKVTDSLNFPTHLSIEEVLMNLQKSQKQLVEKIGQFSDAQLEEKVPGQAYSFFTLLHGIIHHDLYHLGQIVMIKKYHN